MNIIIGLPPNIDAIREVFSPPAGAIYTYGDTIYNPGDVEISKALLAHEGVHAKRQTDPEAWWDQYMKDVGFRLNEELLAHQAEYREIKRGHPDRNIRVGYLHGIARRLSGKLYNNMIDYNSALDWIENG